MLFASDRHAPLEVYNDINGSLVNLFRCVKYHAPEVQRQILAINSRELFLDIKARHNLPGRTDIQRAADFYMLIRTSYGSKCGSYICTPRNLLPGISMLEQVQQRLSRVSIEHRDFADLLRIYDRPGALFYLDPPYYGAEYLYEAEFSEAQHSLLNTLLKGLKGRFILSYNDHPFIRELYKDFTILPVTRQNNLAAGTGKKGVDYRELIIKNY